MDVLSGRNIALTGLPRGGTTLACQLLGGCIDTVGLFEPMDVMSLPMDRAAAIAQVASFFSSSRESLQASGRARSKQAHGRVPDNPFAAPDADGHRRQIVEPGWIEVSPPRAGFALVVKHNAAFAALLPELAQSFETVAIVRNPVAALGSWWSVDLPVSQGRAPAAERFDASLRSRLDACTSPGRRQIALLDWFFSAFATLPPSRVIRYEDIVASDGRALFDRVGLTPSTARTLQSRNASRVYPLDRDPGTLDALVAYDGAWRRWYPQDALATLAARSGAPE